MVQVLMRYIPSEHNVSLAASVSILRTQLHMAGFNVLSPCLCGNRRCGCISRNLQAAEVVVWLCDRKHYDEFFEEIAEVKRRPHVIGLIVSGSEKRFPVHDGNCIYVASMNICQDVPDILGVVLAHKVGQPFK